MLRCQGKISYAGISTGLDQFEKIGWDACLLKSINYIGKWPIKALFMEAESVQSIILLVRAAGFEPTTAGSLRASTPSGRTS